jgi:hypothetical protein
MPALLADHHEPSSSSARALATLLDSAPHTVRSTPAFATALQHLAAVLTSTAPDWLQVRFSQGRVRISVGSV